MITSDQFIDDFRETALQIYADEIEHLSSPQLYHALAYTIRKYAAKDWAQTKTANDEENRKQVYYFAIEFLPGRLLASNILNEGLQDVVEDGLRQIGLDPQTLYEQEADPGLGNGGLGRLGSAFLDSMASIGIPGNGNGIRYREGLFEQRFINGWQVELPDDWLRRPYAWETRKENRAVIVRFGGHVDLIPRRDGQLEARYTDAEEVLAVPYDIAIIGYENHNVNTMRLWSAELPPSSTHTYTQQEKERVDAITSILYPDDSNIAGRELRLRQEYFFVSAGVQSIIAHYKRTHHNIRALANFVAIHINDTHPAMTVAELMRILLDQEHLDWDTAWQITVQTLSYTNHTILAEALETWPYDLFAKTAPRLAQIISEIDRRFRARYTKRYGEYLVQNAAPVADGVIRMAYLAVIGSHSVNGVANLHTELLKTRVLKDFNTLFPTRFINITNGITPRRWLQVANRPLSKTLDRFIGKDWRSDPEAIKALKGHQDDPKLAAALKDAKRENKVALAAYVKETMGLTINPDAIFDVQIKRLHAYKRQLLHVFGILEAYRALKNGEERPARVHVFGAKAAPSYTYAKEVIRLINAVADLVNNDPDVANKLQVVFLPNYGVSLAEKIIPAADISEQISLAGLEASGTSNMKLMASGALTLATLDGANIEIGEAAGRQNLAIFGLTEQQVATHRENGDYSARAVAEADPVLTDILDMLIDGRIPDLGSVGQNIYDSLITYNDDYFVLADFADYVAASRRLDVLYGQPTQWAHAVVANIAASGRFSSDYTVARYDDFIWHTSPNRKVK